MAANRTRCKLLSFWWSRTTYPRCLIPRIDMRWKHLSDLKLADPDYEVRAGVGIFLGRKVFSKAVLHGRQYSPTWAPSAFKTCLSWVLNGEVNGKIQQPQSHVCGVALTNSKEVYKGLLGKTFCRWMKSKNREVLAGRMLAPGCTKWRISRRIYLYRAPVPQLYDKALFNDCLKCTFYMCYDLKSDRSVEYTVNCYLDTVLIVERN